MKKADPLFSIGSLITVFLFFSACTPKTYQVLSNYQASSPAQVTGTPWPVPQGEDKKTSLAYAIGNDETNLYLRFQTVDPVSQMKILRSGLEMEITVPGKENAPVFLKYPVPEEKITVFQGIPRTGRQGERPYSMQGPGQGRQNPPDLKEMVERTLENQEEMMLKGFINLPDGMLPLENENGVCLSVHLNPEGMLEYRLTIPLSSLTEPQKMTAAMANDFLMEIRLNALERPVGPGGRYGSPGIPGSSGPGGIRPGGSRIDMPYGERPAGAPRESAEFSRLSKNESFRVAFKLAENQ